MRPTAQDPDIIAGFYEAAARRQGFSDAWSALCTAFDADTGLLYRRARPAAVPVILAARNWSSHTHDLPRDMLCATASLEGTASIGLGLRRPAGLPLFTGADRDALDGMGRHVAAALRLESLLAAERLSSAVRGAAIDICAHGIVVLNATGAVLFANAAARHIAAEQGILFGQRPAGLRRIDADEAARLEALITSAGGGGAGGCVRITRHGGLGPLAATIDALPDDIAEQNGLPDGAYVMVTLRDLGATTDAAPSQLMDLFGLTAAEAGIVPQLLCGESASMIAQSRGVAVGTVKAQAGKVLAKTGAANLRALSMMIATLG